MTPHTPPDGRPAAPAPSARRRPDGGIAPALTPGAARPVPRADEQRRVRDQAALLDAILDAAAEGVTVCDDSGGMIVRNSAARAHAGVLPFDGPVEEVAGRYGLYLPDRVTPCPPDRAPMALARTGRKVENVEYFVRNDGHPNGVVIAVSCRRIRLADGRDGTVYITRDVTADRARESELVAFAGMVAHDLKTPLSTIAGFAEVLAGRLAAGTLDPGVLGRAVDRIHGTSRQMITLVNDLLDHATARDAVPDSQIVDLGSLVRAVLEERIGHLSGRSEGGPEIFIGDLPPVVGDPAMLRRLLDNLLGNALTYTRPGCPARIDVTATRREGWVRVEVADRGIGIPDADKRRVFQPFQRLGGDRDHGGTGLGLAICRRIVERHGGAITVLDNAGAGARFQFTLPGVPAPQRQPR